MPLRIPAIHFLLQARNIILEQIMVFDDCNNCLCPNKVAEDELVLERALEDNEKERRALIKDLEKAGVTFPVTELEAIPSPAVFGPRQDRHNPEVSLDDPPGASGEDFANKNLTTEDYATNMPDDLKDLLRRYYQLEAERENLKAGNKTAPNSENGEIEDAPLERMSTPRAPLWFFRNRSVAIVEAETDLETQERSSKSRHVWVSAKGGDDSSYTSPRVTVVYPKERTRKIRCWALLFCAALLGLLGAVAYFAVSDDEESNTKSLPNTLISEEEEQEQDTASPVSQPTPVPCTPNVVVNKACYIRGEPIGTSFQNCNPLRDDWLGVYHSDEDPSALSEDSLDWMYTCGNKQCRGVVQSSLYGFEIFEPGTYKIHMMRNADGAPYVAYASTSEFVVVRTRLDCPDEFDFEDLDNDDVKDTNSTEIP